jgi:predicted NUDIX family NTP pyrophosphohydrolase
LAKKSYGILLHRTGGVGASGLEVLLAHPGGPLWAKKDEGAWTIPKGEAHADEEPLAAARREFAEEIGLELTGEALALGNLRQPSGKVVEVWAVRGDFDTARLASNAFSMEWPPRSGKTREFPEVDRAEWFPLAEARTRILKGQAPFLDRLERELARPGA